MEWPTGLVYLRRACLLTTPQEPGQEADDERRQHEVVQRFFGHETFQLAIG
jgi:hypothetical protein